MDLLTELLEIKTEKEYFELFEELGNLGKLGLGSLVNAFKQTYTSYKKHQLITRPESNKFQSTQIGKDSETIEVGPIKNWNNLRKLYDKTTKDINTTPAACIIKIDDKPVALMIASAWDLGSINNEIGLAWDLSKYVKNKEEAGELLSVLHQETEPYDKVGGSSVLGSSKRKDIVRRHDWDYESRSTKEIIKTSKYTGFTQTVREVMPFVNKLCDKFAGKVTISFIMPDKERKAKQLSRQNNPPIDPKKIKLFKDEISVRLAKYKNSRVDSVETAEEFVKKVFGGGLKKINFAGSTYSAIPEGEYLGTSHSKGKSVQYFYNGTFKDLLSGKACTMKFEADRKEADYNTLYLKVKFKDGQLVPVEMNYNDKSDGVKWGPSKTVKFE